VSENIRFLPASKAKGLTPEQVQYIGSVGNFLPIVVNDIYIPHYKRPERIQILYVGAGSGKSDWKATELLIKVLTEPYCRVLFVRKDHVTVRHSQFQLFKDQIARYNLQAYFTVLETPMIIRCHNGNVMLSGGLDDVDKLKSIADITDIWLEEPLDKRGSITADDFLELDRRVRTTKASNHIHFTFNPISQDSWINDYFFKAQDYEPFILKTTYLDNHFSPESQHLTFERLRVRNYQQYLVYALGEWGTLTEGLIFKEYTIVPDFPSDAQKQGYGLDFGFYPDPTALVHCGIYEGRLYIDEIMYDYNMTSHIRAKTMKERAVSPKLRIIADRNPEAIKEISGLGFPKIEAADKGPGSIANGLELLGNYPICITARSVNLKKELDNYSWVIDKRTGKPTGDPIDEWNHAIDAARYWASKHITSQKPFKRQIR